MELGMRIWVVLSGYEGTVAASPRGGKWLIRMDDGTEARLSAEEMRECKSEYDDVWAYYHRG